MEDLLGIGASGEVWRGRVTATGIGVALKRIRLGDAEQRKAALSEAAMLATLDHPNLMKLHEVHRADDDTIVLVLDLAAGGSLAALLARRGRLTVGEALSAIAPIGAALAYAHHSGVVHGDVSSANILFTDIGLPLLADLGVSRLLGDDQPVRTTPAYADPTVAGGGLPTPASDLFMLGAVALHTLTGAPPWPAGAPEAVLAAAAGGEQPDFAGRLARAGVADEVARVVARALTVDPDRRGTAADFALELRHAGDPVAVELSAGRSRVSPSSSGRVGSWPLDPPQGAEPSSAGTAPPPLKFEQPLTHGRRAPSPFEAPAGRHVAASRRLGRPRVATGFAVAVLLAVAAVVGGVLWWPSGGGQHEQRTVVAGVERGSPAASIGATPTPPSSSPAPAPFRPAAVLAALDRTRATAFARRDPELLAKIYASPALLARDRALLLSTVPSGCGLHGARTSFRDVIVTERDPGRIWVQARLKLAASTLVCGGVVSGRAGGAAAVLRVELVSRAGGYRITAQRRG